MKSPDGSARVKALVHLPSRRKILISLGGGSVAAWYMRKRLKIEMLRLADRTGIMNRVMNGSNRARKVMILGFHGGSMHDEDQQDPRIFMRQDLFRKRMQMLRDLKCNVLTLDDALLRLQEGTLPPHSVVLTFDEGFYDFKTMMLPVLKEFGFPATVYMTTRYAELNLPIFNLLCPYLFWKSPLKEVSLRDMLGPPGKDHLDLSSPSARTEASNKIKAWAARMSFEDKDQYGRALAKRLKVDYEKIFMRRTFHVLSGEEVRAIARDGLIDFELHGHNHWVLKHPKIYFDEILTCRRWVEAYTGRPAVHYAYPGCITDPMFFHWLRAAGIRTATTCEPVLWSPGMDLLMLPRALDRSVHELIFKGWISGIPVPYLPDWLKTVPPHPEMERAFDR